MEWDLLSTGERSEPENVHKGKLVSPFLFLFTYSSYMSNKILLSLLDSVNVVRVK